MMENGDNISGQSSTSNSDTSQNQQAQNLSKQTTIGLNNRHCNVGKRMEDLHCAQEHQHSCNSCYKRTRSAASYGVRCLCSFSNVIGRQEETSSDNCSNGTLVNSGNGDLNCDQNIYDNETDEVEGNIRTDVYYENRTSVNSKYKRCSIALQNCVSNQSRDTEQIFQQERDDDSAIEQYQNRINEQRDITEHRMECTQDDGNIQCECSRHIVQGERNISNPLQRNFSKQFVLRSRTNYENIFELDQPHLEQEMIEETLDYPTSLGDREYSSTRYLLQNRNYDQKTVPRQLHPTEGYNSPVDCNRQKNQLQRSRFGGLHEQYYFSSNSRMQTKGRRYVNGKENQQQRKGKLQKQSSLTAKTMITGVFFMLMLLGYFFLYVHYQSPQTGHDNARDQVPYDNQIPNQYNSTNFQQTAAPVNINIKMTQAMSVPSVESVGGKIKNQTRKSSCKIFKQQQIRGQQIGKFEPEILATILNQDPENSKSRDQTQSYTVHENLMYNRKPLVTENDHSIPQHAAESQEIDREHHEKQGSRVSNNNYIFSQDDSISVARDNQNIFEPLEAPKITRQKQHVNSENKAYYSSSLPSENKAMPVLNDQKVQNDANIQGEKLVIVNTVNVVPDTEARREFTRHENQFNSDSTQQKVSKIIDETEVSKNGHSHQLSTPVQDELKNNFNSQTIQQPSHEKQQLDYQKEDDVKDSHKPARKKVIIYRQQKKGTKPQVQQTESQDVQVNRKCSLVVIGLLFLSLICLLRAYKEIQ